jgi:PelA/Pel-15E family pectate lyase
LKAKNELHTTYDNGSTYAQIAYLAKAYTRTKDEAYKTAVVKGLGYIINSQYNNGGWPQYYPLENNYSRYITFNDDAYIGIMEVLMDIVYNTSDYRFIDDITRQKIITSFNKGIDCISKHRSTMQANQPPGASNTMRSRWNPHGQENLNRQVFVMEKAPALFCF